jgi:hypothetical protein
MERAALASRANDDEVGTEVRRDIQKLVPLRSAPDDPIGVNAVGAGTRARDGVVELDTPTGCRVPDWGKRSGRILLGANATGARA